MNSICIKAYGKVNLGLDVIGKREDGYHLVRMIMQTVNIFDNVTVMAEKKSDTPGRIRITCSRPDIPSDSQNLAYRAAELIVNRYCPEAQVAIAIEKRIPVAAGMAGGSADAAAVIRALDQCLGLDMGQEEQDEIALLLGADVPFCLRHGTWLAEGIGEKLTKVTDLAPCSMVIVKPDFGVSTPWAYRELDSVMDDSGANAAHPDIDGLIEALDRKDIVSTAEQMGNILEAAVIGTYPEIQNIKDSLVKYGAVKALMSGSGPTVFGIFTNAVQAEEAFSHLWGGGKYGKFKVEF